MKYIVLSLLLSTAASPTFAQSSAADSSQTNITEARLAKLKISYAEFIKSNPPRTFRTKYLETLMSDVEKNVHELGSVPAEIQQLSDADLSRAVEQKFMPGAKEYLDMVTQRVDHMLDQLTLAVHARTIGPLSTRNHPPQTSAEMKAAQALEFRQYWTESAMRALEDALAEDATK